MTTLSDTPTGRFPWGRWSGRRLAPWVVTWGLWGWVAAGGLVGTAAEPPPAGAASSVSDPAAPSVLWVAPTEADVKRYRELVTTLASEQMEGRGAGTAGLERARDYLVQQFRQAGLEPVFPPAGQPAAAPPTRSYLGRFETQVGTKVTEASLTMTAGDGTRRVFQGDKDYTVMGFSAQATVQGEAVFVGYGVKNEQRQYDSYLTDGQPAAKDALRGKIAICWRYEPMTVDGQSAWGQKGTWQSAQLHTKAALAVAHGAAALLFVNPPTHAGEGLKLTATTPGPPVPIPVVQITGDVWKAILAQAGRPADDETLRRMQRDADEQPTGLQTLAGVTLTLTVRLESLAVPLDNVAGVLRGAGALADQYVTVGAHYDHLGFTAEAEKRIFFGADDNASGTAGVVLLAERFANRVREKKALPEDRRALLFVAFAGEERGLLGSRHLAKNLGELGLRHDQVAAMLNLDMIGRIRDERVLIGGLASGDRWDTLVDTALRGAGLSAQRAPSGFGPSDHSSFYAEKVPVLFFFDGAHSDLHSPRDTVDKINWEGAVKITNVADAVTSQLWTDPRRMAYVAPKPGQQAAGPLRRDGAYLGIRPEPAAEPGKGVRVAELMPDGPATKAGLQTGDVIMKLDGAAVASVADLVNLLTKRKPGEKLKVTLTRGAQTVEIDVTLGKP